MKILVVNAGSSSLKYQLFDMETKSVLAKGNCERIGIDGKLVHTKIGQDKYIEMVEMKTHSEATRQVMRMLLDKDQGVISSVSEISAIGHRVVQGGPYFSKSVLVDDTVIEDLEKCIDLAPLHTKPHLMGIAGCKDAMPDTPQVLVFDTAFHQTMPEEAYFYPIPYELYKKYQIRRYGFHGTSHRYVSKLALDFLGLDPNNSKIITCHLGNGSSISAIKNGKVIDTSMGFTPLEGIEMGTRCGSMDPAIVTFIMEKEGYSPKEMSDFMNKQCGILGVSEVSSDLRDIEKALEEKNPKAELACKILAYGIKKYIGSYTAAMNGLDAIVFTAGVGENTPIVRLWAMENLEFFGVKIDPAKNEVTHHLPTIEYISADDSRVKIIVAPTNEELVIAEDTQEVVANNIRYERKFFD